ncbi:interferon alpha/beta receptor 1a-like isoform X1 [Acipenser ruthenus]|uniref:interferon alpha/beta receptor 1a-like isoform X1 n=1 Tax=Acipenser ruthenus TaxID=7906 RepID=UPI0027411EAA|nr:interferon alpha/beta receptor 1a-like isoform X1 [Acipenser ruthenus]
MIAVQMFLFLDLLIMTNVCKVTGELPFPQNIRVKAVNTQYILEWDWNPQQYDERVRFTVEYIFAYQRHLKVQSSNRVCYRISQTQCDFTYHDIHYSGEYYLRLRAESKNMTSMWKEIKFCPEEHSALGPPSKVDVESRNGVLKVYITDPLTHKNESMQNLMKIYFLIVYWKNTSMAENRTLTINNTETLLTRLEPWTLYCLRVQAFNEHEKRSQFTEAVCQLTTCKDDGQTPVLMALYIFFSSVGLLLFCSYGVYVIYKVIKYSCFPQLPDSMQLYEITPNLQNTEVLLKEAERELCCEMVSVELLEPSPPIEPASASVKHDCQNSADSGVYSSEEGSGGAQATEPPAEATAEK